MFKTHQKSFGGKKPWDRGRDRGRDHSDFGRSQMHPATCSQCGAACEVPFRPNGKKPVLCGRCFHGNEAPSFRDRGSFHKTPEHTDNRHLETQLKLIQEKLDAILELIDS